MLNIPATYNRYIQELLIPAILIRSSIARGILGDMGGASDYPYLSSPITLELSLSTTRKHIIDINMTALLSSPSCGVLIKIIRGGGGPLLGY